MRTRVRGWRRRHNPLRRRCDVVEGWTVLLVALLLFVGAPLLGAATAWWGYDQAQEIVAEQRTERHQVRATVAGAASGTPPSTELGGQHSYRATVHWTAPDGTEKSTTARIPSETRHGDRVDVWLDAHGRSVPPPASGAEVWQHSATVGSFTAIGTALAVLLAHRAVRGVALRRRMAEWDRDWARTEPQWTHRRA
ncbi:Rv1733c family protein [Streptomyces sp. enrichment culture]|uniref:Rv1733c family protein n=1 Tax=Streptomyces sp. enrichment culture TaxID=1795815 RepID=UPI003F55CE0A